MVKELAAKAIDFKNGELSVFAKTGSDIRVHLSDDQVVWLITEMSAHLAKRTT